VPPLLPKTAVGLLRF